MRRESLQFERGAHDCHLYRTWAERRDVVVPFIHEGLTNSEHCILVTGACSFDSWRNEFESVGIDVQAEEQHNRLRLLTGDAWRTPLSEGTSLSMARAALATLRPLLHVFNGVRIVGDAQWDLDPPVTAADVCHWEATANLVFEESDVRVICQYSVEHYAAEFLHAALRTHGTVIWDGKRHSNRHCEAREILRREPALNQPASDSHAVETILSDLGRPDSPPRRTNGRHRS